MTYNHEVIFCIVNSGFSDDVMDAARELGARGGTVIRARGTANAEAEKLFNIAIQNFFLIFYFLDLFFQTVIQYIKLISNIIIFGVLGVVVFFTIFIIVKN